jgi:hypothetical protein
LPWPASAASAHPLFPVKPGPRAVFAALWQLVLATLPGATPRGAVDFARAFLAAAEPPPDPPPPPATGTGDSGVELDPHGTP